MNVPKRVSSKIAGYVKPNQFQTQNQDRSQQYDQGANTDITRGFLQSQAATGNPAQQNNSQEVVELLNRINSQLESLQGALTAGNSGSEQAQPNNAATQTGGQKQQPSQSQGKQQQPANAQTGTAASQELRNLFSMMLQSAGDQNAMTGTGQNQTGQAQNQGQGEGQNENSADNNQDNTSNIAMQTAAQVLAQAQYELSNELEASLNKLKQVISESEKIAVKISNLLGEEDSQKQ